MMLEKVLVFCTLCLVFWQIVECNIAVEAANPYMPLWEHIPDAEPRVFEDPDNPGKYRVYIYGSHDTRRYAYCGYDIPVWSAPVEDLTDWRYDGIGFQSIVNGVPDVLFAPDVVEVVEADGTKIYYLYPNNQSWGRNSQVAKSKRPDGPFEVCNWKPGSTTETVGIMGFDPAVFVDDDGRVYGYWGFQRSFAAELDPNTMATIKPGTRQVNDMIGSCNDKDGNDFRFFEAASLRKIEDKYVLVYSRKTKHGEYGLGESNSTLAYAYSDSPLGPWTYGGTLVDSRGPDIGENGRIITTQPSHNTHGSILEVNGQWYITYHRSTNNDGYSRQAMVEPINVEVTEDGAVDITGTRIIEDNYGNKYTGAEVTSQGFEIDGLDPYKYHSAGINCYMLGGPYVKATYDTFRDDAPVVNIRNNAIVGFKYFNFSEQSTEGHSSQLEVYITPNGVDGTIEVMMDSPWERQGGVKLGSLSFSKDLEQQITKLVFPVQAVDQVEGKHAIYFIFKANSSRLICDFNGLKFSQTETPAKEPYVAELDDWDLKEVVPPTITISVDNKSLGDFEMSDYDYNIYKYTYLIPVGSTTVPQVTATSSDDRIKISVRQAATPLGTALVTLSKDDQVKEYSIEFSSHETVSFEEGLPEGWEVLYPTDSEEPLGAITTSDDTVSIQTHKPDWEYPYSKNTIQSPQSMTGNWTITVNITTDKPLNDSSVTVNTQVGLAVRNDSTNDFYSLGAVGLGNTINTRNDGRAGGASFKNTSVESLGNTNSYWLRIVKDGNNLQGFYSDGNLSSWQSVGNPVSFDSEFFENGKLQLFASNQSFRTDLEATYTVSLTMSD